MYKDKNFIFKKQIFLYIFLKKIGYLWDVSKIKTHGANIAA
jgi:hypothetical protein